ncbi:MAG: helix-turn-helix domain-containing protein [Desulfovibrio sp.]|uniref:AraC family ligand binding domain-containing protein n=1 Tax=Desulfovibrio sp. 7SRBS1 TaxID=3378064 RepID=UPI003B3D653C
MNVTYWRDKELPALEVGLVVSSAHVFPNHWHEDEYLVGCMERGGSWCRKQGEDDSFVAPGEVCLINPGQVHSGIPAWNERVTYRTFHVQAEWFRELLSDVGERDTPFPEFCRVVGKDRILWELMCHAMELLRSPAERLEKESVLTAAFARLGRRFSSLQSFPPIPGREPDGVRRAKEFLAENLEERISLEQAANVAGLSRYHFLRVFKRTTGLPPHVFRTQQRVEAARLMLRKGFAPAEIALATGFTDQSHFSNTFKKYMGATPRQYATG